MPGILVAAVSLALASPQAAKGADEPTFTKGLSEVRRLEDAGRWLVAKQRLIALLGEHERKDYVRVRRAEILEELKRCAVRAAVAQPDPSLLISGKLLKYDRSTGEVAVSYRLGQLEDFEKSGAYLIHPLVFDGPCTLEVQGRRLPGGTSTHPISFLASCRGDQAYLLAFAAAYRNDTEWSKGRCEIRELVGEDAKLLTSVDRAPDALTKFTLRVSIDSNTVSLSCNGSTLVKTAKPASVGGRFGICSVHQDEFDLITLHGKATTAWIQGLIDQATRERDQAFLSHYDVDADLPEWLARETPARVEEEQEPAFELAAEFVDQDRGAYDRVKELLRRKGYDQALDFLLRRAIAPGSEDLRDYLLCIVQENLGRPFDAREAIERVCAHLPDFLLGCYMRAEVLEDLGAFADAEKQYASLKGKLSDSAMLYVRLANTELLAGRVDDAQRTLREARASGLTGKNLDELDELIAKFLRGPVFAHRSQRKTRHFVVDTDLDAKRADEAAYLAEESFELYGKVFGVADPGERQFAIHLFSGRAGYIEYCSLLNASMAHSSAGMYSRSIKQLLVWDLPEHDQLLRTIRHEACHQYLDLLGFHSPTWLEEGTAEYAELFTRKGMFGVDAGKVDAVTARELQASLKILVPLKDFVKLHGSAFYRNMALHYAEAWAFVQFLHHGGKPVAGIHDRLLAALKEGANAREVVARGFEGVDLVALHEAFVAYLQTLK